MLGVFYWDGQVRCVWKVLAQCLAKSIRPFLCSAGQWLRLWMLEPGDEGSDLVSVVAVCLWVVTSLLCASVLSSRR